MLLCKNYSYQDIKFLLHVSTSTITHVSNWLDTGGNVVKSIIGKLTNKEKMDTFWERIDKFLEHNLFKPNIYS
jgi:hypothetical protein